MLLPSTALTAFPVLPQALAAASPDARSAILQFLAAEIRNPNTRRAYLKGAQAFFAYAADLPGG